MLVAVLQMTPAPADPDRNLARIDAAAESAARSGAALLVTPELSLTGYAIGRNHHRLAESADGALVSRLQAIADTHGLAIVAGFPERDGEAFYNSAVLVRPCGERTVYRKCHLYGPDEKAVFTASDAAPAVFEIGPRKAGLLICYDVEFPEMVRHLALLGADLVIVPTALPKSDASARISEVMLPSRAMENQLFVAYAGLCGSERGTCYQGGSVIVGPDGHDLARAGSSDALLIARLDPDAHAEVRAENPYLQDRRPGLYGLLGEKD